MNPADSETLDKGQCVTPPRHVILDTDIGSDVDDAMALAVILGSPALTLDAVTTVYGDVLLRARLAQRYAGLAGTSLRAIPGLSETLSGAKVWWPGHEGSLHEGLAKETVDQGDVTDAIVEMVAEAATDVIAIGPLGNIARALRARPELATEVHHLWVMGGDFGSDGTLEHNFRSDAVAAAEVFATDIPATVFGLNVTEQLRITESAIAHLGETGPLGLALLADIAQWRKMWDVEWNVPHDPLTVLAITDPQLFEFSGPGRISIEEHGAHAGRSTFTPGEGSVRIATAMDVDAVAQTMMDRIERASRLAQGVR